MESKAELKKSSFRENADFKFFYDFLNRLIREKVLLWRVDENIVKNYFENSIATSLVTPPIYTQIRRCFVDGIKPKEFIESYLIPPTKNYILGYSDALIEENFNQQIQEARQKYVISEMVDQLEKLRDEAPVVIKKCFSHSLPEQEAALKQSNKKWNRLIAKALYNQTFVEGTSVISSTKIVVAILSLALVAYIYPRYLTFFTTIFSQFTENPQEKKRQIDEIMIRSGAIEIDSASVFYVSVMFFVASTGLTLLARTAARSWLSSIEREPLQDIIVTAGNKYREACSALQQAQQQNSERSLLDILSPEQSKKSPPVSTSLVEVERKRQPKRYAQDTEEVVEEKKDIPIRLRHLVEKVKHSDGSYSVRLNNAHGMSTQLLFKRPRSPIDPLARKCFEVVENKPVVHSASSRGEFGLKRLGSGEHKKYKGCVAKIKFHDGTRVGVTARPLTIKETQVTPDCKKVWEANLNIVYKK